MGFLGCKPDFKNWVALALKLIIKRIKVDEPRSNSAAPRSQSGMRDPVLINKLKTLTKKQDNKQFAQYGKAGESDRRILEKKPKHLYCGKRGIGKNDRR